MARLDLPDSNYAELRDAKKVPERLRRPVRLAALALQRTLPEGQRQKLQTSVKVDELKAPEASEDVRNAFGAPPIDALAESAGVTPTPASEADEEIELPTDEQQRAADEYNALLVTAFVTSWSFGDAVSAEAVQDLPGDAYDALLEEVRRLNKGDEEDEESLASDPSTP